MLSVTDSGIFSRHLQNQVPGLVSRMYFVGDILTRLRLFLCRVFSYTKIMVGWAGAPQGAPVANKAGKTNSVQSTTHRLVSKVVVYQLLLEAATMATTPPSRHTRYLLFPSMPPRISPSLPATAKTSPKP